MRMLEESQGKFGSELTHIRGGVPIEHTRGDNAVVRARKTERQWLQSMELPGRRQIGKPKRSFMEAVKEDVVALDAAEKDTKDRVMRRNTIYCGDRKNLGRKSKEDEDQCGTKL